LRKGIGRLPEKWLSGLYGNRLVSKRDGEIRGDRQRKKEPLLLCGKVSLEMPPALGGKKIE
jgi:hypothetical protein